MPVCLKCGKEVDPGRNFCEDCGILGEEQVRELLAQPKSRYKPNRRNSWLWAMGIIFVLFLVSAAVAWALLTMMPTNKDFVARTQANLCRRQLVKIQNALQDYYANSSQYPPLGKITDKSPLVVDGYIPAGMRCPSTKHPYLLQEVDGKYTVICDSGLAGHSLP